MSSEFRPLTPHTSLLTYIALRGCIRTLELEREWGLRPQPGVLPLHPVLSLMAIAITNNQQLITDSLPTRLLLR